MKKALAARGADPSTGHMKVDVRGSVNFVKIQMAGSSRVRSARRANVWRRKWTGGQGGERVGEVQEIVEITVDSGAAKSVWPIRKKGVARTEGDEDCDVGGSKRLSDTCGRRCEDWNSFGTARSAT